MDTQLRPDETVLTHVRRVGARHPERPALVEAERMIDYGTLVDQVERAAAAWALPHRSLIAVAGVNQADFVVTYLSVLAAGHVPMVVNGEVAGSIIERWRPAGLVTFGPDGAQLERLPSERRELHPDLGIVLSTSGSTGSAKLVRLSHRNVVANAASIRQYLGLGPADRAITVLPLHYCYGLSVMHSHLVAGASILFTQASVVDPCFQRDLVRFGVTNLAGVPHTFELLERSGFFELELPSLRFVTQAGGRMPPDRVRQWASRLESRDVELFVMYGQTEATARMAYLPPRLAATCPEAIGLPIPGGSLELRPHPAVPNPDTGELVYRGANVMMGYAEHDADLARGHDLTELRTGDLARRRPDGLFEIVGRAARFVKPFGLRIDLDHLERTLAATFPVTAVTGDDHRIVVAVATGPADAVRAAVGAATGLPDASVVVVHAAEPPRTPNGKIDYSAVATLAPPPAAPVTMTNRKRAGSVATVFAEVLGCERPAATDTFVGLGGDSLSYVECSVRLEQVLGRIPPDWHLTTVAELEALPRRTATAMTRLDTTVLLRAFSICAVVSTHMRLQRFPGGAHLLLAVAGYNYARFQLAVAGTSARLRNGLRTALRVGAPASAWIGLNVLVAGGYSLGAVALVNNYTGSAWRREGRWQYWFFEVFVQIVVLVSLLLAIPAVRRLERRAPFGFAAAFAVPCLAFRFGWIELGGNYNYLFRTHTVAWFFALGWMIATSSRRRHRLLVSALAVAVVPGFFGRGQREAFIIAGLLLLVWLPTVPVPRLLRGPIAELASSSMWIFLVHWQVWPILDAPLKREAAYVLTIAVGLLVGRAIRHWRPVVSWMRSRPPSGGGGGAGGVDRSHEHAVGHERAHPHEIVTDLEGQGAVR